MSNNEYADIKSILDNIVARLERIENYIFGDDQMPGLNKRVDETESFISMFTNMKYYILGGTAMFLFFMSVLGAIGYLVFDFILKKFGG